MDFDANFFAGEHSFELGKGRTGGIMDYGDGTLSLRLETFRETWESDGPTSQVQQCGDKIRSTYDACTSTI